MKKFWLRIITAIVISVSLFGSMLYAKPAKAFFIGPYEVVFDPTQYFSILYKEYFKNAVTGVVINSASYFFRRLAYDSAVWVASGGKGQSPLLYTNSVGNYLEAVAGDTFGVALEEFGKPMGLNLCKIPDARLDLTMRIGIQLNFLGKYPSQNQPLKPECTWNEFRQNWTMANFNSMYNEDSIEERFNVSFKPEQSDLGLYLTASQKIDEMVARATYSRDREREQGGGYKPLTSPISGEIITPPDQVKEEAKAASPSAQRKTKFDLFQSAIESGATNVASVFLNTLVGEMMNNWRTKGMFPFGLHCDGEDWTDFGSVNSCKKTPGGDLLGQFEGLVKGGRQAAQQLFSSLLVPQTTEIERYDTLANLSNCPENPASDNCVADESLVLAAQEARNGKPITIGEALAKGWLRKDWKLLPPERSDNSDKNCYQRAYCYANIAKLRKFRILPLGFEIAAQNSDPDKPWTLDEVVKGFNDCNFIKNPQGKIIGITNDPINKPFCRLIDPNWVIKSPISKCNAMAYGPSLYFPAGANRSKECVDNTTCVAFDKNGNCASYGYCVREENTWKMDAEQCDQQYRTCRAFTDSSGKAVSYLYRTLDTGNCNQDNVGCAAYSLIKSPTSGTWIDYNSAYSAIGENSEINFNNKLSSNCSSNSAGCSSFVTASTSDRLYIKKAPYYAKCYDSNTTTLAVNWPQSKSDLVKLESNPECANYAQACLPEEVSCSWYDPVTYGGDRIPGKFKPAEIVENEIVWNDQCSKKCVGYSAYMEMASNYSAGSPLEYIIPSSGSKCSAQQEGCSSFTNLSTTVGGMEKVEYYSYLRPCITPEKTKQKNFYTYEGSTVGGYQLRSFVLEKDTDGSPKYFYTTAAEKTAYDSACNENVYKSGLATPDCRQFNDDNGSVYYKLLSKTIAVSQSCTPYRLNDGEMFELAGIDAPANEEGCLAKKGNWEGGKCNVCFLNGEYKDGSCLYNGLPENIANSAGSSRSCSKDVVSCRAYKGNAGNNTRNVFYENFEGSSSTLSLLDWNASGGSFSLSAESTRVGEHSLAYQNGPANELYKRNLDLKPGKSYSVSFWAKGTSGKTLTVNLGNDEIVRVGDVGVADEWRSYNLGPIELKGTSTSTQLQFQIFNANLNLDNVRLTEIADYLFLVKNTLSVDPLCDSDLNDNLPGEALGCAQYNANGAPLYLTGFNYLCREKAIGCTALYDTQNTDDPESVAHNVWLNGVAGSNAQINIDGTDYSCQVPVNKTGCYVKINGATVSQITTAGGVITSSTVYVGADTASSSPIYLVANQEASCSSMDVGCVKAGRKIETPTGNQYEETIIRNDPSTYDRTLCQSEAVGCSEYSYGDGKMYFKDPLVVGQRVCEYKTDVTSGTEKYSGWFWKGTEDPCYPSYLQTGNIYGLWSYGTAGQYQNFVGECPLNQSGCTEFLDHNDNDKKYYLIDGENLKSKQSECNGQVSQKYGCILLDKTDQPNKFWTASSTYLESEQLGYALVAPSSTSQNDSNYILKVTQDRECGEWLQCKSSHRVWDAKLGKYKEVCDAIGRCDSVIVDNKGEITNCANWVDGLHEASDQILSENLYRNRDVSWKGMDYSGYSLLNTYPIEELSEVNMVNSGDDWRLVKKIPCGSVNCADDEPNNSFKCKTKKSPCGSGSRGICSDSYLCVQTPEAGTADVMGKSPDTSCRAYPEEDSPFPSNKERSNMPEFSNAKLCQESNGLTTDKAKAYACECDYTKVNYGDALQMYWNYNQPNSVGIKTKDGQTVTGIVPGICSGGANDGFACSADADCGNATSPGTCNKATKETKLIGWRGYCLEPDISRQINGETNNFGCLTWYPKENISGALDINNQHVEAGYVRPAFAGKYYCLGAKGNQQGSTAATYSYEKKIGTQTVHHKSVGFSDGGITLYTSKICSNKFAACAGDSDCTGETDSDNVGVNKWCVTSGGSDYDREKRIYYLAENDKYDIDEIDYIKIQAYSDDGGWFEKGSASSFTTFYIRNGLKTKYNGSIWTVMDMNDASIDTAQKLKNETQTMQFGRYVFSDGTEKTQWDLRYDDGGGDGQDQYQFADPTGRDIAGPFADLLKSGNANIDGGETDPTAKYCEPVDDDHRGHDKFQKGCMPADDTDNYDDGCAIRVGFNNGKMEKIYFSCFTGDGEDAEWAVFKIYVGLREPCKTIAQVENSAYDAVGWTDRLWERSTYSIPNIGYRSALTQTSPFGSLPVEMPQNKLINIYSVYDKSTFETLPAVEGSPYSCTGQCLTNGSPTTTNSGASNRPVGGDTDVDIEDGVNSGKDKLSTIFTQVKKLWEWQPDRSYSETYATVEATVAQQSMNRTETATDKSKAPKIKPIGSCSKSGTCLEPSGEGLTVNGKSSGDVVFQSHSAPINIKFYAYADKNQMPLKKVTVNWGDGESVALNGYFRNHRGAVNGTCDLSGTKTCKILNPGLEPTDTKQSCVSSNDCRYLNYCQPENLASNFGQIQDRTCDNAYFRFDHVYQCIRDGVGWKGNTGSNQCSNEDYKNQYGGCCEFTPKVQAKDNWGWCNGECAGVDNGGGASPGGDGCYDKSWHWLNPVLQRNNECDPSVADSNTPFSGKIIVPPAE